MPHNVLLIDDSPAMAQLVEARLGNEPVVIHYAPDAEKGLDLARQLLPDLILLDVDMPGIDGFECCRRLKVDPDLLSIPVVFLSGTTGSAEKILGLEMGAVDYVSKPLDAADLRARVRSALRLRRLSELLTTKARVDPVTGLWNERHFEGRLTAEANLATRSGRPVSVVLCDIDHFRKLNTDHGPWFGDEVLRTVADLATRSARQEDVVCRVNGATIGIICPSSSASGAAVLARRLHTSIAGLRLSPHGVELRLSVSVGVAGSDQAPRAAEGAAAPPIDAGAIRHAATIALETAKSSGRDRIVLAGLLSFPDPSSMSYSAVSGLPPGVGDRRARLAPPTAKPDPKSPSVSPASHVPPNTQQAA